MKASELMIGDWVQSKGRCMFYSGIFTDFAPLLEEPYRRLRCMFNENEGLDVPENMVNPIPLTEEILEDNGWDVNDSCYAWYKIDEHTMLCYYWYEKRLTKVVNIVDEWQNHSEVSDITFRAGCLASVHGLQHALRLCGLNDMADNFNLDDILNLDNYSDCYKSGMGFATRKDATLAAIDYALEYIERNK